MPDIIELIRKWWKQMTVLVILAVTVVGVITWLKPRQYLSVATAVPASSYTSDKEKIFGENIQILYSALGTPDDLDLMVGTGNLDTVYTAVTREFNLYDHYKMKEKGEEAIEKATSILKKNSRVSKTGQGELKVRVWDTDNGLAPQLANSIMAQIQRIHQHLMGTNNRSLLAGIRKAQSGIYEKIDSINRFLSTWQGEAGAPDTLSLRKELLHSQWLTYEKMISEYQLMVDANPPSLLIVEHAKTTHWPDRPNRVKVLMATFILSLLFSLLLALVLEKRKKAGS